MAKDSRIFVFGSNLGGRHGKGAALFAKKYRGAIQGQAEGLQGQSYAIPTKDHILRSLPVSQIWPAVYRFRKFAEEHPEMVFQLTAIGCMLAGNKPADIAWMFADCADNIDLPPEFKNELTFL
jgi:hypothetical protein